MANTIPYLLTLGLGDYAAAADSVLLITGGLTSGTPSSIVASSGTRFSAMLLTLPWRGINDLPGTPSSADERAAVLHLYARGTSTTVPVPSGTFVMDVSALGGGQYRTVPFDMVGEFRQIQLAWRQASASQDMEPHYFEFHFTPVGVDETVG
jgi:hypothetical protein